MSEISKEGKINFNDYFNKRLLKDSLKMINPVTLTLFLAIFITAVITIQYLPPGQNLPAAQQINIVKSPSPSSNPTGATGAGLANALIFVGLTLVGGLVFVLFIKYGLEKLMNLILAGTFFFAAAAFSTIILPFLIGPVIDYFQLAYLFGSTQDAVYTNFMYFIYFLAFIIGVINFLGFTVIKNQYLHNTLMISFGVSMGVIFGIFFDSFSLLFVLVGLALYDIYAVFRGPLRDMFERLDMKSERDLPEYGDKYLDENSTEWDNESDASPKYNESYANEVRYERPAVSYEETSIRTPRQVKNPQISRGFTLPVYATPFITIGLGDFAFFSVLIAKATFLALKGNFLTLPATTVGIVYWSVVLFPFIGILFGCYLTFVLLQKYEMLPALPLPISGGLIGLFLAFLLQLLL